MPRLTSIDFVKTLKELGYSTRIGHTRENAFLDEQGKTLYINDKLDDFNRIRYVASAVILIIHDKLKEQQMSKEERQYYRHKEGNRIRLVRGHYWNDFDLFDTASNNIEYFVYNDEHGCCSNPAEGLIPLTNKEHVKELKYNIVKISRETV